MNSLFTSSKLSALRLPFVALAKWGVLAFHLLLLSPTQAILDVNTNGMSDLWEKQHNSGNLFPNTFLGTDDPDQDGWTNATEATAGTDPHWANPPDGIIATTLEPTTTAGAYTLTWPTIIGKNYRLQASYNLINWLNVGDSFTGTASSHTSGISAVQLDTTLPPKLFWRVVASDLDTDTDGLTNAEENTLGTDPTNSDTDGDTLLDKAEILANTNPLDEDTDEDGLADNLDATPLANNAIADPDGANLPTLLNQTNNGGKLIGRYDFETLPSGASGGFPSAIPGIPAASATDVGWDIFQNPSGMPSFTCRWNTAPYLNEYLTLPYQIADDRNKQVWSYWLKLPTNAFTPGTTNTGVRTLLAIGINRYAASTSTSSPLPALHWYCDIATGKIKLETYQITGNMGIPITLLQGNDWDIPPAWNDGQWHHIVLHKNDNKYNFYFDGTALGQRTSNNIYTPLTANSYIQIGRRDQTATTLTNTIYRFPATARLDRLRCYTELTASDIHALYNQDIDRDGLFDRTESRTRIWRDHNNDTVRNTNESDYILRPFHHDSTTSDHDRDGIPSHTEQNGPITSLPDEADTDGDILPDGWERDHGLSYNNPSAPPSTNLDPDLDGVTNLREYQYHSNPNINDTDADGTQDGPEITQASNPADPTDNGQAPPTDTTYTLRLGVGDNSGSHSEKYHLVVYEYDWQTHTETEIRRHVSGQNYGEYSEADYIGFDQLKTYTFQIQWQGTNRGYNEAADYDYTLKVENSTADPTVTISQTFAPATATFQPGEITGTHSNIANFSGVTETLRALVEKIIVDLAMDYDMDGTIETLRLPLTDSVAGLPAPMGPDLTLQDKAIFDSDPHRYCVIDVNNNNTDAGPTGGTTFDIDNANNTLDTEADRQEMLNAASGHSFGKLRLWSTPNSLYGMNWRGNTGQYSIRLSLENPETAQNIIRVFDWAAYEKDPSKPEMLLGPGKTSSNLSIEGFFDQTTFANKNIAGWFHNFCVEGISYGTATIKLEIIDNFANDQVIVTKTARVMVNVDQFAQPQTLVPTNQSAIALRGASPHFVGIRTLPVGGTVGYVRAIKGRIVCRVPSFKDVNGEFHGQLTKMRTHPLRINGDSTNSGQSFWLGLRQDLGNGEFTWAQCGLRWFQTNVLTEATAPIGFIETGTKLNGFDPVPVKGQAASDGGDGVVNPQVISAAPLQGWEQAPLILDFVMWKKIITTEDPGARDNTAVNPWKVIFKDARDGKGAAWPQHYIVLSANAPTPQVSDSTVLNTFRNTYKAQKLNILDANLESSLSCAFAVGKTAQKGSISQINQAYMMTGTNDPSDQPQDIDPVNLWTWLQGAFAWEAVSIPAANVKQIVRTGRNSNTNNINTPAAEEGTQAHPFWRTNALNDGFEIWDTRDHGFGQQDPLNQ